MRYEVTSDDETREIFAGWYGEFAAQHIVAVAKDYNNGLFAGTDEVIEKFTGKKPMGFEEFTRQHVALYKCRTPRPPGADPPPRSNERRKWLNASSRKPAGTHEFGQRRRSDHRRATGQGGAAGGGESLAPPGPCDRLRGDLPRQFRLVRCQCRVAQHRERFPGASLEGLSRL